MKYGIFNNIKYILNNTVKWDRFLLLLFLINTIVLTLKPLPLTFLPQYIVENLSKAIPDKCVFFIETIFLLLIGFLLNVFSVYLTNKSWPRINKIRMKFMILIGKKTMELPYEKLEDSQILDLAEKTGRAWECMDDGIAGILKDLFILLGNFISSLILSSFLFSIDYIVFIFSISFCIIKFLVSRHFAIKEDKLNDFINPLARKYNYWMNVSFNKNAIKDIVLFCYQKMILSHSSKAFSEHEKELIKVYSNRNVSIQLCDFLDMIYNIIIYAILIHSYYKNNLLISEYVFCFSAITHLNEIFSSVLKTISHMYSQNISVNTFRKYCEMDVPKENSKVKSVLQKSESINIRFDNVNFRYPGSKKNALSNISFEINSGEKVALLGLNGAGKSTIVHLLLKFYTNYEGEIYINNINLKEIDVEEIYQIFSAVFQNIYLYAYTLKENIAVDNNDSGRLNSVLTKTGLYEHVQLMPLKENSQMTKLFDESGIELSVGETQKVAICRALYKSCNCVVLDEPTSSLDTISEYDIYSLANNVFCNKTGIFITHRLIGTVFSDRIIILEDGKIVEQGTPKNLLLSNGLYAKMFKEQLQHYENEEI